MAKYNILVGLYLLVTFTAFGQDGTFNMAKSLPYPEGDFSQIIVYEDTIVGYGVGFNNNVEWKQGLVLAKFDSSGNIVQHNFLSDSIGDLFATGKAWGNIIRTTEGGYAAIAATVGRESAFLIKMTNDLQVEFIKEYPDTVNLSNYFYKLLETPEGYLLYGAIQRPDYNNDGFIRYVDKQGETIWFKYFEFSQFSTTAVNIQPLTDTTYISSFVSTTNLQGNIGFSAFMIFDINGDESGFWQFPIESVVGANRKIIVTNEGDIIAFGLYKVDMINNTPIYQPTLIKFDDQFTPTWVSHFGRTSSLNASIMLWDFAPTHDGHYVGAGETLVKDGDDPSRRVGWLYKFSVEGDSIWERKINAPFLPLYFTNSGFFAGVGVLSSGSIVAGGSANEGNTDYCWLVKVTNDGCLDTLFCQAVSVVRPEIPARAGVRVYPNPVKDLLRIDYPGGGPGGYVRLLDMQGRLQRLLPLPASGKTAELPVGDLPEGLYLVQWFCNGQAGYAKVVIAH